MPTKDPIQALNKYWTRFVEVTENYAHAVKRVAQHPSFIAVVVFLVIAVDPAAAQSTGNGLHAIVQLLNNIKDLLQTVGLVLAVVSLMAAGIAWMLGEVRLAKKLVRGAIIGVLILVLAGPIVDFLKQPLQ